MVTVQIRQTRPGLKRLEKLEPGTAFRIPGTSLRGVLMECTFSAACIKQDIDPKLVSYMTKEGKLVEFITESNGLKYWAPSTEVEVDD